MNSQIIDISAQHEILAGLKAEQKHLSPKFFYDKRGARLFEDITRLPEYYPTRTEITILKRIAGELSQLLDSQAAIIEPGAGNCQKVRLLLPALKPRAYIPQDVSSEILITSAKEIENSFPNIEVHPVIGDFSKPIVVPDHLRDATKYVFYPGSTIGNFSKHNAIEFLTRMRAVVGSLGGMILGADLHKETSILNAAYNDTQGITAAFNLNSLCNINRILGSKIDPNHFVHHAFYNEAQRRIEMHLISRSTQSYNVLGHEINFTAGETIHTESSHKYMRDDLKDMAQASGFQLKRFWTDAKGLFSVSLFRAS